MAAVSSQLQNPSILSDTLQFVAVDNALRFLSTALEGKQGYYTVPTDAPHCEVESSLGAKQGGWRGFSTDLAVLNSA